MQGNVELIILTPAELEEELLQTAVGYLHVHSPILVNRLANRLANRETVPIRLFPSVYLQCFW